MSNQITDWKILSNKVYWHRSINLEDWIAGILNKNKNYILSAIRYMSVKDFIYYLGVNNFIKMWPELLKIIPKDDKKFTPIFNLSWSLLISKSYNLIPYENYNLLNSIEKSILTIIAKKPGLSTLELSNILNIDIEQTIYYIKILEKNNNLKNKNDNLFPFYKIKVI